MPTQRKLVKKASGGAEFKAWEMDMEAIRYAVSWANANPFLLEQEVREMEKHFPFFIATVAKGRSIIYCSGCGELLVWQNSITCINCEKYFRVSARSAQLAYIGQIPSVIGEVDEKGDFEEGKCRPFFRKIFLRLTSLPENLQRYISETENGQGGKKYFFTPPIKAVFSEGWPRGAPDVVLESEYFQLLGIPLAHAFPEGSYRGNRLCLYSSWPKVTLRVVLQQRIVPRIIIDLMLADLQALGKLDIVLDRLSATMEGIYNIIGRGRESRRFEEEYHRYVKL